MKEKTKGLMIDIAVYAVAFGAAAFPFAYINGILASSAAFTACATLVVFAASTALSDVSVYDPYWSVAPVVIIAACMIKYRVSTVNAWMIFALICVWSARLTVNWYITYKGLRREDWRYAMYRKKYRPALFHLISFAGLHFVPTAVVYAGLVSALLSMCVPRFSYLSLTGAAVMLASVCLELVSDLSIHRFLKENSGKKTTCRVSVWKYSRHPNYLGEMSFWTGLYIYFVCLCPQIWYKGLGFVSVIALFFAVSIPLMEKHNAARREDYADYKAKTSLILLLPNKKQR